MGELFFFGSMLTPKIIMPAKISLLRVVMGLAIVIASIGLAGCGDEGPSGTYATNDGKMQMTFNSGGELDITFAGITQQGTYSFENGKVKYADVGGRGEVMTTDDNGCLESRFFGKLCKR